MATRKAVEQVQPGALLMSWRDGLKVGIAGLLTGLLTMALYVIIDTYIFSPTLCSELNVGTGRCDDKLLYASGVAMVVAALPVLIYFVRQRVYRPLLVVLLSVVSLWGVPTFIGTLTIFPAIALTVVIFGLTYALFAWLVQVRNFVVALILSIVVVFVIRLLLSI